MWGLTPHLERIYLKSMFYVYVLKSQKDEKLYIGLTSDLRKRLAQHNNGKGKSTAYRTPFNLVYYEAYLSEKDALTGESQLKRFSGSYVHLRKRIGKSLILSK